MQKGVDLGFLMSPGEGAVTALAFYTPAEASSPTHLLSGAADGSVAVWAASGGWDCMKILKGHQ
jgi:protein MAK11